MIVFIGCVKRKRSVKCQAKDMYTSTLFKYSLAYAKMLTRKEKIYILSAKYGVIRLNEEIEPYELSLADFSLKDKQNWAWKCVRKLEKIGINFNEDATFLCGENYRKHLVWKFKNAKIPMKNLSFGNQLKFLKEKINEKNK